MKKISTHRVLQLWETYDKLQSIARFERKVALFHANAGRNMGAIRCTAYAQRCDSIINTIARRLQL